MKAEKIVAILSLFGRLEGSRVLEVGAGSGHIAARLAEEASPDGSVQAVDVVDELLVRRGFEFRLLDDTRLPFNDATFDFAISNHVLEHVRDRRDQEDHLSELIRVLAPGGFCFLAVPNRWRIVEPHYHLPFLSWLRPRVANLYVRGTGRGAWYDVNPPSRRLLMQLIAQSGLFVHDMTVESMRLMADIETNLRMQRSVLRAPVWLVKLSYPVMPTFIYVLEKQAGDS